MNYFRMTIRPFGDVFQVFKLKRQRAGGYATDMQGARFVWFVSGAARAEFTGTYGECCAYIESKGAEFMSEHGISC